MKRKIDQNRKSGQYIITGSQRWGVLKSIVESLAGRAVFIDLEGFSLREIANSDATPFWLERWLNDPTTFISSPNSRVNLPHTLFEHLWRGTLPQAQFLDLNIISKLIK